MEDIRSFLESLKLGRRQSHENLQVFPLMAPQSSSPDYLILEEALAEGCVCITELSEGGSVPELRLFNDSPKALLIVEGEELVGAKQNRIVNATFLVPGKTELVIPVSCVEQGRWHYKTRSFHSGGKVMHASLRRVGQKAVGENLASERSYRSDQGMIWSELNRKVKRMSVDAPTGAMADLFECYRDRLEAFTKAFSLVDCQVGAVFALNGLIAGMECFFHQATFGKFFGKLIESYALDALDYRLPKEDKAPYLEDPKPFLQRLKEARPREYPTLGLGRSLRIKGESFFGAALVEEGKVLHMNVFADQESLVGRKAGFQRFSERARRAR
jgi:hypothetical protein